ncbi:nucleolin-like [Raphanus sativus]|nr:nucleolin-like [Raphanus sativus]
MAKTRGGGKVGSRRSRRNQGLEVVDQGLEDKRPQLKVKKATAKKTASPKKSLVLTPTRRIDEVEDVLNGKEAEEDGDGNGKEAEEDGDGNGKEAEEDGDGNGKENEDEQANMEDDGSLPSCILAKQGR